MCEECKKILEDTPREFIEAMELHGAELAAVLAKINEHCNADLVDESLAESTEKEPPSREDFALVFAPYVIGFVMGSADIYAGNPLSCASDINRGAVIGNAYRHSKTIN